MNTGNDTFTNPFHIRCEACGAPAQYDIIHENYHCQHCGETTDLHAALESVASYRKHHAAELKANQQSDKCKKYNCPNCGAIVVMDKGEATADCDFCGTKLVNKQFLDSDAFPELLIPFKITLDEAKEEFRKWLQKNSGKEEAKKLAPRIDEMQGYYLPYQIVKGPVKCEVARDSNFRKYNCGGFIDEVAVNTSKQLDNLLLNAMEPFDWREIRPFEYGFIAGLRIKLQDIKQEEIDCRIKTEIRETYLPVIEKTLQTQALTANVDSKNVMEIPALMPVYIITRGEVQAAVNGQTGRVSVTPLKKTVTQRVWVEPLLTVLFIAGLCEIVPLIFHFHPSFDLTIGLIVVSGLIVWAAHSSTESVKKTIYYSSVKQLAKRINNRLTFEKADELGKNPALKPVFFEKIGDKVEAVKISFYTLPRIIKAALFSIVGAFLPNVLALLLVAYDVYINDAPPSSFDTVHHFYAAAWWCFMIPVIFILWIAIVRRDVFEYPVLYRILPDGSTAKVENLYQTNISVGEFFKLCTTPPFLWITIFVIVVVLGCTGAILS